MATVVGSSAATSGGGWAEARLTYSVSGSTVTFTKLEVRKQPSSITVATTGTWSYSISGTSVAGTLYASVSTAWVTLWSGSATRTGSGSMVISASVSAPSGTSYAGLTATASTTVTLDGTSSETAYRATLVFDANGGTVSPSSVAATTTDGNQYVSFSSALGGALPTPAKSSCTFLGWYYNGNLTTSMTWYGSVPGVTYTLVAQWQEDAQPPVSGGGVVLIGGQEYEMLIYDGRGWGVYELC